MEKIHLSNNHNRSVSASMYLIEKKVCELERELMNFSDGILVKIISDIPNFTPQHYQSVVDDIKLRIAYLAAKYNLRPDEVFLSQSINAQKSAMWEILCDTTSNRLKGYGEFPKEYAQEFDADIDKLQKLIASI